MIVGVFGPRDVFGAVYSDFNFIADTLDDYEGITKLFSGGGIGVEELALRWASAKNIDCEAKPPNIKAHNGDTRKAFRLRNEEIIGLIQLGIFFWDGRNAEFYTALMQNFVAQGISFHVIPIMRNVPTKP